jgi:uncharacterized membrane protein
VSLNDWILSLHVLSAFALIGPMTVFWTLAVAGRNKTDPDEHLGLARVGELAGRVIAIGVVGTLVFGLWLSFSKDDYAPWNGWIAAAIVLWVIGGVAGSRSGSEFARVRKRAEELQAAGQTAQPGEFHSRSGELMLAISSLAGLLILIDMVWKPGA